MFNAKLARARAGRGRTLQIADDDDKGNRTFKELFQGITHLSAPPERTM
jgi:hypothetical protein